MIFALRLAPHLQKEPLKQLLFLLHFLLLHFPMLVEVYFALTVPTFDCKPLQEKIPTRIEKDIQKHIDAQKDIPLLNYS